MSRTITEKKARKVHRGEYRQDRHEEFAVAAAKDVQAPEHEDGYPGNRGKAKPISIEGNCCIDAPRERCEHHRQGRASWAHGA